MKNEQTTTFAMHLEDIKLEILSAEDTRPVPVELYVTEEKNSEYMVLAMGKYGVLHFRITELSACSIWHTRFLVNEKMRLRVSAPIPCTFLWVVWKNQLYYSIKDTQEQRILTDHYNLYHLPEVKWQISFRQPGEYETFNILFTDFDLEEWKHTHAFSDLEVFLNKANQGQMAFLSPEHKRLSSSLQKAIADLIRGPVGPANRQVYYENKVMDLFFHLLRDMAKTSSTPQTILRQPEIEKLYEMRDILSEDLEQPHNLKDLAQIAGMNQTKLEAGFRQLFKTTVFGFIREQRMQKAHRLLKESHLTVKEVAFKAGYKNLSNFTEAFTKYFGYPPSHASRQ